MHQLVIHWFRRDLRLTDNTALNAAVRAGRQVLPVFLLPPESHGERRWTGGNRREFLRQCVCSLDANLRSLGGALLLRSGSAVEILPRLVAETGATAVSFNRDPDPFGRSVEAALARRLAECGVELISCADHTLHPPDAVLTGRGEPYRIFTPYRKAWCVLDRPSPGLTLRRICVPDSFPPGERLSASHHWRISPVGSGLLPGGERAARERMKHFLAAPLASYGERRDFPALPATSRLSQDLRFGLLSIRELFARLDQAIHSAPAPVRVQSEKFASELVWREFYFQILTHFPEVLDEEFQPTFRGLDWPGNPAHLERWQEGTTGFPIVDAGMRELRETGFMHNRVRMIVAMFLTKDLHLDWRLGESWFMRHLADGEIASNNGGWQWSAGTGADAAPWFRIQNPWTQTARYDPDGLYIKKWIPALKSVPPAMFMAPPSAPLAPGYPLPLVDHARERERTLEIFNQYKAGRA